jgi:hypothetical protein
MRLGPAVAMIACAQMALFTYAGAATISLAEGEGVTLGASIFCDSAGGIRHYLHAAEMGSSYEELSSSINTGSSCVAAAAAYLRRGKVGSVVEGMKSFGIIRITVVGVFQNGLLLPTIPREQYMFILEPGVDI